MGNHVCIVRTKFENLFDGKATYGYRMYDDYGAVYNNLYSETELRQGLELFQDVVEASIGCPSAQAVLDYIEEFEAGVIIDGEYFEFQEIKHLLNSY